MSTNAEKDIAACLEGIGIDLENEGVFIAGRADMRKEVVKRIRELIADDQSDAAIRHTLLLELEEP